MKLTRPLLAIGMALSLLIAALLAPDGKAALLSPGETPIIHYDLSVNVDYDKTFLDVVQNVAFANRSQEPLSSLVFHAPPIAFDAFLLRSAAIADSPVTPLPPDGIILELPLSQPLMPGNTISVTLKWGGKLPPSNGRYGASAGVLVLGDWYAALAVLRADGSWERHQYLPWGDAFFEEAADYTVSVTAPTTVTVASSAQLVSHKGGQWQFQSQNARDFAMGISSRFQTTTRKVASTTITVYYLPSSADGARKSLDMAEQAMKWYSERIGAYPYPTLAVVEVPGTIDLPHTAQEHAGLFFLRSDIFTPSKVGIYVAHELAHAWFFGNVGNDQIREPWLDEGLVTAISCEFYRVNYPKEYPEVWQDWGGTPEYWRDKAALNEAITYFDNGKVYFAIIYQQGATFFQSLRELMGDDSYWQALDLYQKEFAGKIARPQDLLRILRESAGETDLVPTYRLYLDYPWLKFKSLTVAVGGVEGSTWQGQVSVPITVTADSPTYTLTVLLDTSVLTTTNAAITVAVDASALADGEHELTTRADDGGMNQAEAGRTFFTYKPTPTPTVTSTPAPTATGAARATAVKPTETPPAAQASPTAAAAPRVLSSGAAAGGLAAGLLIGLALVAGAVVAIRRRR